MHRRAAFGPATVHLDGSKAKFGMVEVAHRVGRQFWGWGSAGLALRQRISQVSNWLGNKSLVISSVRAGEPSGGSGRGRFAWVNGKRKE